jgi:glutathione S-transferase
MKLYSANLSPYGSRARLAIYAKGLPVEISLPPGGPGSAEYRTINPTGKVPCLVTDAGDPIGESDTIVEYLEDAFAQNSLRPASPERRARARMIARVGELYVLEPMSRLFGQMNPQTRDPAVVAKAVEDLEKGVAHLEAVLAGDRFAAGPEFTTADCQLAPTVFYLPLVAAAFGKADLVARHPKVAAYVESVKDHPAVQKIYGEMAAALQHFQTTGQIS